MPIAPALRGVLDTMAANRVELPADPPARVAMMRTGIEAFSRLGAGEPPPMAEVSDESVDGPHGPIPIRVYRPIDAGDLPVVVYFHGGGFVCGTIDTHDTICRRLAKASRAAVVSVGYRLAPEHPFPVPLDDCAAVTAWAASSREALRADSSRIAVAGDSAGGNLAAAVALRARGEGPRLAAQVLVYPATDAACATPSMAGLADGYLLTADALREMWSFYVGPGGDASHPASSVLRATDLAGLPPALVITAEYDPLRDEGEAYAKKMSAAGVTVQVSRYDGMIHGFLGMPELVPEADEALAEVAAFLRTHL